jgi:NADH-quinone oxidoreductase subunit J
MFQSILFYVFAAIMFMAALGVVFSRNPVHSVMLLVLTFFNAAILWLMAEAEFLAIVLVLVYVGAVMVLFLFVVMMLDVNVEAARRGVSRYAPLGIGIALLMVFELIQVIWLRSRWRLRRVTATPKRWGRCYTPSMSMPLKLLPSFCCWRLWRRSH